MAQVLVGYDVTGSVLDFDEDGNILAGGTKLQNVFILPFSRLLVKDEIKKGTFNLELGMLPAYSQNRKAIDKLMMRKLKQREIDISNAREEQLTNYLEEIGKQKSYPKKFLHNKKVI